jgi:hypothetical protein
MTVFMNNLELIPKNFFQLKHIQVSHSFYSGTPLSLYISSIFLQNTSTESQQRGSSGKAPASKHEVLDTNPSTAKKNFNRNFVDHENCTLLDSFLSSLSNLSYLRHQYIQSHGRPLGIYMVNKRYANTHYTSHK